jgi:hypothetical protein
MTTTARDAHCGSNVAVACGLFPFGIAATPNAQLGFLFDGGVGKCSVRGSGLPAAPAREMIPMQHVALVTGATRRRDHGVKAIAEISRP